jgi:hypothetical protein
VFLPSFRQCSRSGKSPINHLMHILRTYSSNSAAQKRAPVWDTSSIILCRWHTKTLQKICICSYLVIIYLNYGATINIHIQWARKVYAAAAEK